MMLIIRKMASLALIFSLCMTSIIPIGNEGIVVAAPSQGALRQAAVDSSGEILPDWAKSQIEDLLQAKLIEGYEDGTFQPGRLVTRAEMTALIGRAAEALQLEGEEQPGTILFQDVQEEWFAEHVQTAARRGWVQGFADRTFRPHAPVTRQEAAVIFTRLLKLEHGGFLAYQDKAIIPEWAVPAVTAMSKEGFMGGYPDGTFKGGNPLTRAEIALLLHRVWLSQKDAQPQPFSVKVNGPNGEPLANAHVTLHDQGERSVREWGMTNADGVVSLRLPYGQYEVTAGAVGSSAHEAVHFRKGMESAQLNAVQAAVFKGSVLGEDGKGVGGIVLAFATNPTFFAVTDSQGAFTAYVLPERNYRGMVLEQQEDAVLYRGDVPAFMHVLDQEEMNPSGCKCRIQYVKQELKAAGPGEVRDLGVLRLSDINKPPGNGGGNGSGSGGGNGGGNGGTPDLTPPAIPSGFSATANVRAVDLRWNGVADTDLLHYNLYASLNGGLTWGPALTVTGITYQASHLIAGTPYTFAVSAVDRSGNESAKSLAVTAVPLEGADVTPPEVPSGLSASAGVGEADLQWNARSESDLAGYRVYTSTDNGVTWGVASSTVTETTYTVTQLTYGMLYTFAVTSLDLSGNESAKSSAVSVIPLAVPDNIPPAVPAGLMATAGAGKVDLQWLAVTESDLAGYIVYYSSDSGVTWTVVPSLIMATTYSLSGLTPGTSYKFAVTAKDMAGNESGKSIEAQATIPVLIEFPPDPVEVATEIPVDGTSTFAGNNTFLFSGSHPIQTGVTPGAIEPERLAVLRGAVFDAEGKPLAGVTVTILDHGELGRTLTRANGNFDLAINGGGTVTVQYEKQGYMSIQRKANAPWGDYATLPDVVLKAFDTKVTTVELSAGTQEMQVAQGSPMTDADGTRQATLLIPQGTTAVMKLPDGSAVPLPSMNVRATEYTVGDKGMQAMPGELPAFVGYTYAVELSADEAVAAGATEVHFSQKIYTYVDNFLKFPIGETVPSGYYDRETAKWVPSQNGMVIKILAVENGRAVIDGDGDGVEDDEAELAALRFTESELQKLGALYTPGKSLWRVPIEHFTPWDFNWPYGLPEGATNPPNRKPNSNKPNVNDPCQKASSIIGCQEQTLGEVIPITGTNMSLHYYSRRAEGYESKSTLEIPVMEGALPPAVIGIGVNIQIAGRTISKSLPLTSGNTPYRYTWDGKDAYGRQLIGSHPYEVTVYYLYRPVLYATSKSFANSFGQVTGVSTNGYRGVVANGRSTSTISTSRTWHGVVESPVDVYKNMGLAGWSLSPNHHLDNESGMLARGSGFVELHPKSGLNPVEVIFRSGATNPGKGVPAANKTTIPTMTTVGADGDLYLTTYRSTDQPYPDHVQTEVFRVKKNGEAEVVGTMIKQLNLDSLKVGRDGTLYATSWGTYRIWKKSLLDSEWVPFAGSGDIGEEYGDPREGIPATDVRLYNPKNLEIADDGSLYYTDSNRLYRIGPDGLVTHYGFRGYNNSGSYGVSSGPISKRNIGNVADISLGPDGSLYLLDDCGGTYCAYTRIRKMSQDGNLSLITGASLSVAEFYDGIAASKASFRITNRRMEIDRYGNIYFISDVTGDDKLYRITPDQIIEEVAGDVVAVIKQRAKDEGAIVGSIPIRLLSVGPQGEIILQVQHNKAGSDLFYVYSINPEAKQELINESGTERYLFDMRSGRHVETKNALTGGTITRFTYDAQGRLSKLTDRNNNEVKVERDENGVPTAIVAPGGQRTVLTVEGGQLTKIANPAGEAFAIKYDDKGLLTEYTDPNGHVRKYGYDEAGYLISSENPLQGKSTLTRDSLANGYKVTYTTPGNQKTMYEVTREEGQLKRVSTDPSGAKTTSVLRDDGTDTTDYADGTKIVRTGAPDPRWGYAAPMISSMVVTAPNGRKWTFGEKRQATLDRSNDPLSLKSLTMTYTKSQTSTGTTTATSSVVFDVAEKKFTETSAEGVITKTYLDSKDRVVRVEYADSRIAPVVFTYDEKGRLQRAQQGDQFVENTYDAKNRLIGVQDAAGQIKRYTYDDADRVIAIEMPSGKILRKGYDDVGNLTEVTTPNSEVYYQSYNGLDQFNGFMPDGANDTLSVLYNTSGKFDKSMLPSGREVLYGYDATGRINLLNDLDISRTFTYLGNTDRVSSVESMSATDPAAKMTIGYKYDGTSVTEMTWNGLANGKFTYTYDGYANLKGITMTAGNVTNKLTAIDYDRDFNVTRFGPFTFSRGGPAKRVDAVTDGTLNVGTQYDANGKIKDKTYKLGGVTVYKVDHVFDKRGFVTNKTVTTAAGIETYAYGYGDDGQLTQVSRSGPNGSFSEAYDYDSNRNRILREVTGFAAETAEYGAYDLLEKAGDVSYTFDKDGFMTAKGADTFRYGTRGELLEATVNGETYRYGYDALGRRISREASGKKIQYLFGDPNAPHRLTAVVEPDQSVSSYFYDEQGKLLALERGGIRYYVVTDAVGTPQMIIKGDRTVVKKLQYDSYGNLISDSNPSFTLALGYAGGLADDGTKLVRFGFRDYDPHSGRWTAKDPILLDSEQANLYAYVNNNPIQYRDPCGLFCVGASAYEGVGGGGKVCITDEGFSACVEAGVGVGCGFEINPMEDLSNTELVAEAAFKASWGPASFSDGIKVTSSGGDCPPQVSLTAKAELGPFGYDFMSPSESSINLERDHFNTDAKDAKNLFKKSGTGFEAALKAKACAQYKW
ncbi:S-layer homology domain-containing protein [Paenibacillus qinlingensis]|uniref:S-layer homology domain-containing protein n=1 Tax=Paenibacillus qinlingensis TaxID=1837343 RepID=UPI0015650C78|nr:S-layer homology domain-containing protein [Paenibacillus qinlingensis]NQX62513.1 S-layer homology domain-containing protein [Paenibacillus qinlingensis]